MKTKLTRLIPLIYAALGIALLAGCSTTPGGGTMPGGTIPGGGSGGHHHSSIKPMSKTG